MTTSTTLCLLEGESDIRWISDYLATADVQERVVIAVYSLPGRLAAGKSNLPCTFYDDLAQAIDPLAVSNISRNRSSFWAESTGNIASGLPASFKGYPLAAMHAFNIMISMNSFLPFFAFTQRLLQTTKPNKVLMGWRENPFHGQHAVHINISPASGFERECAQTLCRQLGIPAFAHDGLDFRPVPGPEEAIPKPPQASPATAHDDLEAPRAWRYEQAPGYHALEDHPRHGPGQCHLLFAYGYFHLDDLLGCIDALLERSCRVVVIIIGGEVEPEKLAVYAARGVRFFRKESFRLENEAELFEGLKQRYSATAAQLTDMPGLEEYFSAFGASFYKGLMEHCLNKELSNMPFTILELLRAEAVLEAFTPDTVFVQFSLGSYNGWGNHDALPARKLGLPTLCFDHGINGVIGASLSLPATQYHATYGEACRQAIINYSGFAEDKIRAVGNPRYEALSRPADKQAEKLRLGMDPHRPVVVYCSTSEVVGLYEYPHSTHANIQAILKLKRRLPSVQLIYRVHHGLDFTLLRQFFEQLGTPDLFFEISLEPPHHELVNLLKGTDVLISQAASCLTEAVVMGVPVIYYCARSNVDPLYLGSECIAVASRDEDLPGLVRQALEHPLPPGEAEAHRQLFLERAVCGNDGQAGQRLADFLQYLATAPREPGWEDWLANMARQRQRSNSIAADSTSFNQARRLCLDALAAHDHVLKHKRSVRKIDRENALTITTQGFWPEVN